MIREQLGSVLFALFHVEQIEAGGKGLSLVFIEFPGSAMFFDAVWTTEDRFLPQLHPGGILCSTWNTRAV